MKLSLILFFTFFTAIGQNIKGTVLDKESRTPLENVNVILKKEKTGAASNERGEFDLITKSKINPIDTISFSIMGYEPKSYSLSELHKLNFVIFLSKKEEILNEIIISSEKKLKSKISYNALSPLKKGVYNFGSTLIDNKIYIIGGDQSYFEDSTERTFNQMNNTPESTFDDVLKKSKSNFSWENYSDNLNIYNLESDTWITSIVKFRKRAYHKIIPFNNKIYVLGGKTLSKNKRYEYLDDKIEILNLYTQKIIVDNTNPHQAINSTAVIYQDNIIVMGGSIKQKNNGEKVYTDQSHIYNITTGYWYELPKMTKPKEVNGLIIKNKIYLIGGLNKIPLTEIESYDLFTEKWNSEGDLFYGIENPALTYNNNTIYIFNDGRIMTYNIVTKILKEYRIDLNLIDSQIYCYDNNLYILGGLIENNYFISPSPRLYSVDLNEFAKTKFINSKNN